MAERAWLIEAQEISGPVWLEVRGWSGFSWTGNANQAIRFCRREDAEQIGKLIETVDWKATEHLWEVEK